MISSEWYVEESVGGIVHPRAPSFKKTSEEDWMCATRGSRGWRSGVHMWVVKLDRGATGISVGVVNLAKRHPKDFCEVDFGNAHNNMDRRWDIYCGRGCAVTPYEDWDVFGDVFGDGNVLMVRLDVDRGEVYYGRNWRWRKGPVFTGLPQNGLWFPYFALERQGCTFTVIKQEN